MYERNGWMPEWIWNWMNARQQFQTNALAGFGGIAAALGEQTSPLGIAPSSSFGGSPNPFYPPKK